MQPTRRGIIIAISGTVVAALLPRSIAAQVTPQPMASPNAPPNQNVPAGLDGAEIPVGNGSQPIPAANWIEIQSDAQKLLQMATDFKNKVDHTNLASTLPLQLIDEARHIEKLARQIQNRMKR